MSGTATLCLSSWLAFLLLVPTAASARIYKWTDDRGITVFSNTPPAKERNAKDVEVVIDEDDPPRTPQQIASDDARRREQEMAERIYNLERQVQMQQQYPPYAPLVQPQYQPLMSPPSPDYYGGSPFYPGYYPGYIPPYFVLSTGLARPAHRFSAHRSAPGRFASFQHGGGVSRARR
jgi:hypothetical protein